MNLTPTPPALDLELIRKAMREYQPIPRRIPFTNLKPFYDSIVELRRKNASYAVIADMLKQHGVPTSRARVAEYGRIVLDGGKRRKRRKHTVVTPAETPKAAPIDTTPVTNPFPPPPSGDSSKLRGPRIAKIELLPGSALKP